MEILIHGSTYKEKECKDCGALIGYSYRDIEYKTVRDAYNNTIHETTSEYIYCPECGCRLVLSLSIDGNSREIREDN